MPSFPFGELAPDRADLEPGMTDVRNAIPGPSGYLPFREISVSTSSLSGAPLGAIQAQNESGQTYQYAGDTTTLYENVDGTWTDRSPTYTTAAGERWEFAAWKNKILATNYTDNPQFVTFGGVAFADLTTTLKARHIAVVRDFVVFGNTNDGSGTKPSRVRWSAFDDETDYTVSPTTGADFQDLKASRVQRIFGGEYGVIFQPASVWRMSFTGAPTWFQFDETLPGVGLIAPGAAAQDGDIVYFLSSKGFFALEQGTNAVPIGAGRVDEFVRTDLDLNYLHRMSTVADPNSKRVFFSYPGAGNTAGRPNRIVVYDRAQDRWSIIDQDVELIWAAGGVGASLDSTGTATDPDLVDGVSGSFDDPTWVGGAPFVAAFNSSYASGPFTGDVMTATLTTKEYALTDGGRTQLNGFRALVQGGTITAEVGTRNNLADEVTYGSVLTPRAEGRFATRSNARYHRFRFTLSDEWQHATGVEIGRYDLRSGGLRG